MVKRTTTTVSERKNETKNRYWLRTDERHPNWPAALVLFGTLILLYGIGGFRVAPEIEAEVAAQVSEKLDTHRIPAAAVSGNGQGVVVYARAAEAEKPIVQALAASTQCETWAGSLTCPTTVDVIVETPDVPVDVHSRTHDFSLIVDNEGIQLSGEAPDRMTRAQMQLSARNRFAQVDDQLSISNEQATDQYPLAVTHAFDVATHLMRGQVSWRDSVLSVKGMATKDGEMEVRKQLESTQNGPSLGDIDIQVLSESQSCNEKFSQILAGSNIQFRSGSADIDDRSTAILSRLAAVARNCPGHLTIAGHTDSNGEADMNRALSEARAIAVRDALGKLNVDTARIGAKGYGDTQPVADNDSVSGRAKNRRIAIAIANAN